MDASTAAVEPPADEGCAVERLFDAHHERLFKLARRLSTDHDQARDLVQETFPVRLGETVVVGTSKVAGDKAIVLLLTPLAPRAPEPPSSLDHSS